LSAQDTLSAPTAKRFCAQCCVDQCGGRWPRSVKLIQESLFQVLLLFILPDQLLDIPLLEFKYLSVFTENNLFVKKEKETGNVRLIQSRNSK
jgi:hypothetical protein